MVDILKIIKEEISNYDFLGLDEIAKEDEYKTIINSKQFQTQFVNDVINDINNDSKFKKINTLYKSMSIDNAGFINEEPLHFDFEIEMIYTYNNTDINLNLMFDGDNIEYDFRIDKSIGDHDTPTYNDFVFEDINWNDVKFNMFTNDGYEIEMKWLERSGVYHKFIKALILPLIEEKL